MTKGFCEWLKTDPADIICLQETKATKDNVNRKLVTDCGYEDYWFSASKKGYSGVAVFTKIKPDNIEYGNQHAVSDDEGRVIQLDFGDIRLINAYFPSGTTGDVRQDIVGNIHRRDARVTSSGDRLHGRDHGRFDKGII